MISPSSTSLRCFTTAYVFASTKDELRKDLKSLQVQLQKSNAQRMQLEQELVETKQIAFITRQQFQESLRQYQLLKSEVESAQTAKESQREGSQVAVLHAQRTVLAQRVLQLLTQNGKLQSTSVRLQHQMEEQKWYIQKLEQELSRLRNSDAVVMAQNSTTSTSRSFWKGRSSPGPKLGSEPVLPAIDTPSCHQQASLEQRIQELESQNHLLLDQQEQSKQHWDQERDQMQQNMTVLQQKIVELENAQAVGRTLSNSAHKREFPPYTISYEKESDDIPDKDQLSLMTDSTCSVTHASRSRGISPSAYLALQGRLQQIEAQLQEKQDIEDTLKQQIEELRQVALEEKQRATSAEERVQSLRAYLNAASNKPPGQDHHREFPTNHTMIRGMSEENNPTETSSLNEESNVSTPPRNSSPAPRGLEISHDIKTSGSDALDDLQQLVHLLEEKNRVLNSKNTQLHRRLEQKTQENAELEDLVTQLKSKNGDGAETIFALLRQLDKSTERDADQESLHQQVDHLTTEREELANRLDTTLQQVETLAMERGNLENGLSDMRKQVDRLTIERDNLTYRLRATERQLAHVHDRVVELNDLNERLKKEAQVSLTGSDLQDKVDAQEKELNEYKSRCDQLLQESLEKGQTAKELHDQNEMLLAGIAKLSKRSIDLSTDLDLAKGEIERLCQNKNLLEKSEESQAANETREPQTKNRDPASENECSSSQEAEEFEALETSLKEANEQRREAEVALANMRLELDTAKAKIDELSTGRATAHVEVSTNPTSIDSRLHIYELEKENRSLSRRCQDNENRLKEALMQRDQHEQMLETVVVQMQELEAQINQLEEAERELTHQSETQLQATYDVLDQRIKVLEDEIFSLETERNELKALVESQTVLLESTTSKLRQTEDALQAYREQLESPKLQEKDREPNVETASVVSGKEFVDIELSASNDDQLDPLVACENTAPNHGKRTFIENIFLRRT